jgi:hypothetical protein
VSPERLAEQDRLLLQRRRLALLARVQETQAMRSRAVVAFDQAREALLAVERELQRRQRAAPRQEAAG